MLLFSEESDPTHFQQVYDTDEEARQFLWTSYSQAVWREFGGWNENGAILPHYMKVLRREVTIEIRQGTSRISRKNNFPI